MARIQQLKNMEDLTRKEIRKIALGLGVIYETITSKELKGISGKLAKLAEELK